MRRCFVLCLLLALGGCTSETYRSALSIKPYDLATLRDLTPQERITLASLLSHDMKDPNAAQFRWSRIGPPNEKGRSFYCAMVNGKNSYGGYVGYQPFYTIVTFNNGKITGIVPGNTMIAADSDDAEVVKSVCQTYGLDPDAAI